MEKWMKNGTFGENRWKNGRKNSRKTGLFFTKIRSPVSGVGKWGEIEVSGGLRKIGDFIGLQKTYQWSAIRPRSNQLLSTLWTGTFHNEPRTTHATPIVSQSALRAVSAARQ